MPVYSIDTDRYEVQSQHGVSPHLVLLTNERELDSLPLPLRHAADSWWLGAGRATPAPGPCGWMLWNRGEGWLQGTAAHLRYLVSIPERKYFIPVHYAGADGVELVGVEPRAFSAAADPDSGRLPWQDSIDVRLRLAAAPGGGESETADEPWRQLRAALRQEAAAPGAGVPALALAAQAPGWHPLLQALCLRNLIVALMRTADWRSAGELLSQAAALHPGYRDLDLLNAQMMVSLGRGDEAVNALRRATRKPEPNEPVYVGSGGESSYRAHYLLALLAERTGRQDVAIAHFLTGVRQAPAFGPAVAGLLRQRLPPHALDLAASELSALARRQPEYQTAIFNFLLLHRAWPAVERALRHWPLSLATQAEFEDRWTQLAPLRQPVPSILHEPAGVVLAGPLQMHSSVARINRCLAAALAADPRFDLALDPSLPGEEPLARFPDAAAWSGALRRLPRRLDLTLRHGWPPDFAPPPTGRLALILPWEFGAIPRRWLKSMEEVDRVFVPSAFVREVLVGAGISAERLRVVPNGVDSAAYRPEGPRFRPEGARSVCFLFVGGAIRRKGLDVLLRAWRAAFSAQDDVSLVIKELGGRSFYRHLSLGDLIHQTARDPGAAPVIHIEDEWTEDRMPELYRGADVVVLPYRGEGFGMPLAEGLACGKPVIATAAGPAPEFCPAEAAWFIPAETVPVPRHACPPDEPTAPFTWFEPSLPALIQALREAAAASGGELARRGAIGASVVRRTHDWDAVTRLYLEHLSALLEQTQP